MDTQTTQPVLAPRIKLFFALAVLLQFVLIAGMVVQHEMKVRGGTEVILKTVPVDPRDLLVGNYVQLSYDISSSEQKISDRAFEYGETVYVTLAQNEFGEWEGVAYSHEQPSSGVFLAGKVTSPDGSWGRFGWSPGAGIEYGIESYFTSPEDALALERNARTGALLIRVSVDTDGSGTVRGLAGVLTQEDVIARAKRSPRGHERDRERLNALGMVVTYLEEVKAATGRYPEYLDLSSTQFEKARAPQAIPPSPGGPSDMRVMPNVQPPRLGSNPYLQQVLYSHCSGTVYHIGINMETDFPDIVGDRAASGKLCPNDQIDASTEGTCEVYDNGWWDRGRTCMDLVSGE